MEIARAKTDVFRNLFLTRPNFAKAMRFAFAPAADDTIFIGNQIFSVPKTVAAEIHLADIVAASSCFPGAFEPIRFPDDFYWQSPLDTIRGKLIQDVDQSFPPHDSYQNGFNVERRMYSAASDGRRSLR